jgi:hypothetical protein
LLADVVWGQRGTGSVSGIVIDRETTLPGAMIYIQGTQLGAVSDADGRFQVLNIPVGKQVLTIQYIGFSEYRDTVNIVAGQMLDLGKLTLKELETELEAVQIVEHHEAGSDLKAINLMKNSPQSLTVVSSETMEKLPDHNAAEAVKRVAGAAVSYNKAEGAYISLRGAPVDWTSVLINGDRLPTADEDNPTRSLDLEVFPSELLDYIIVNRSVTPDVEGDNIGGVINLVSRASVDKKNLSLSWGCRL